MFIPSRNVWHPLGRAQRPPASPLEPLDQAKPPPADAPPDVCDDPDEEQLMPEEEEDVELSDAEFYQSLRQDIAGVQEGSVPSIADTEHKVRQMRPWSKKRHPRDRYGNRIY